MELLNPPYLPLQDTYSFYRYLWILLTIGLLLFIFLRIIKYYNRGEIEKAERIIRIFFTVLFLSVGGLIAIYYLFLK